MNWKLVAGLAVLQRSAFRAMPGGRPLLTHKRRAALEGRARRVEPMNPSPVSLRWLLRGARQATPKIGVSRRASDDSRPRVTAANRDRALTEITEA